MLNETIKNLQKLAKVSAEAVELIKRQQTAIENYKAIAEEVVKFRDIIPQNEETIISVKDKWLVINMESTNLSAAIKACVDYLTKNARGDNNA